LGDLCFWIVGGEKIKKASNQLEIFTQPMAHLQ